MHVRSDPQAPLVVLVEELLDAQLDTIELALDLAPDPQWAGHRDYLKRLRREADALLARLPSQVMSFTTREGADHAPDEQQPGHSH
jgi:hypothetical protein